MSVSLSVSVVTYSPQMSLLEETLASLLEAVHQAMMTGHLRRMQLILVDNGPAQQWRTKIEELPLLRELMGPYLQQELISGQGNVGYGKGHNLALQRSDAEYHLVLNPDVRLAVDAISTALSYMKAHPAVGLLAPAVQDDQGEPQYLCKRYPSVLDLGLRGFVPAKLRKLFHRRLARYEMRDVLGTQAVSGIELVSGCFMFLRRDELERVHGFSPAYPLYFEDYDLSLRLASHAKIDYVPTVRIVHHGGFAARKGWQHIRLFITSGILFFQTHGWKWW